MEMFSHPLVMVKEGSINDTDFDELRSLGLNLEEDLPVNLNLLTLQPWYWEEGSVSEFYMVRIEHIFQAGEHEGKY